MNSTDIIIIVAATIFAFVVAVLLILVLTFVSHTKGEAARQSELINTTIEKLVIGFRSRHASETVDALSVLEKNRESVRQHKKTFDEEMRAYMDKLQTPDEPSESKKSEPVRVIDQETGHEIELIS